MKTNNGQHGEAIIRRQKREMGFYEGRIIQQRRGYDFKVRLTKSIRYQLKHN